MKKKKEFRLCYVASESYSSIGLLYFTDNFEGQWGDDWDDTPYEHNAGEPYEAGDDIDNEGRGNIRLFAFTYDYCDGTTFPSTGHTNSPYSVQDINGGAIAWLFCKEAGPLFAGASIEEATKWMKKAGHKFGELL